ncbi:AbrB family transcriptional regulator [Aquibaculum sediminis]|uniref:AbrB family transcriptional regulator n=1 Tax=Aquibaculum sediminis TaxID=3231907 RepID=UPI0034553A28
MAKAESKRSDRRSVMAPLRRWPAIGLALTLGSAGGWAAASVGLPLPWMIGAMVVTTLASMAGAPIAMAAGLRTAMIIVLGVMLGSGFTPEIMAVLGEWTLSLAAMAVYIVVSTAVGYVFFRRLCGYDPVTAYFSATPGGLNEMVIMGTAYGGDGRRISLVHSARILVVVLTIPFGFRWLLDVAPVGGLGVPGPSLFEVASVDLAILAATGLVGWLAARAVKLPAASIIGPMLASAGVHLAGWTSEPPPAEIVAAAQVAVGAAIGARFANTSLAFVLRALRDSLGVTIVLVVITLVFAALLEAWLGIGFGPLVLAYAPGGLAEMSLIAIALGSDAALVATHHIVRIILIVVVATPAFQWLTGRKAEEEI